MDNFWKEKKVLVTGAGGFIGSHLVEKLVLSGAQVRAFVRYNSRGDPGLLKLIPGEILAKLEIIPGDLRDMQSILDATLDCQYVYHLGALISIPYSYLHPVEVAENNLVSTLNVLSACKENGVERMVHTSSSEVYGTALHVPIDESHPLQGQSPYSASKIGADKLVESFFCTYNLPAVTIRPFNTYGPRQSARAVIPTIITQALTQDEIYLGNLDTARDFTYIDDTVNGFLQAATAENIDGETINLGTGSTIKIGELVNKITRIIGVQPEIVTDPYRLRPEKSEVLKLVSDNSLASKMLDWQPEVTLDKGLEQTIDWIKQNLDQYKIGTYEL